MRTAIAAAIVSLTFAAASSMPAQAQRVDIMATQKRYLDFYKQGNYTAALVEAKKLEAAVRALGGTKHPNYPIVLEFVGNSLGRARQLRRGRSRL